MRTRVAAVLAGLASAIGITDDPALRKELEWRKWALEKRRGRLQAREASFKARLIRRRRAKVIATASKRRNRVLKRGNFR